jgi:autotransporter translocation and assembly factor TamB
LKNLRAYILGFALAALASVQAQEANLKLQYQFNLKAGSDSILDESGNGYNGKLNGSGRISGGLLAPQVNGNVNLIGGEISGPELPISLEGLNVQALIAGESVQLVNNHGPQLAEPGVALNTR